MVAGIFLVTRTDQGVTDDRNQIREVIVHEDDAQTNAQIIAAVIATLNVANPVETGAPAVYPAGYFDTVVQIGASPVAALDTDGNLLAYTPNVVAVDL